MKVPQFTTSTLVVLVFLTSAPAWAQITNGGFEAGLAGWTVSGVNSVADLQAGDFSPAVPTSEGSRFVLMSTGQGNLGGTGIDIDGNGTNDYDVSTLEQDVTTGTAAELSFQWIFLTSEFGQSPNYDDLFRVTVDGGAVLTGSVNHPGGISPFPDTPAYDGITYSANAATTPPDNSSFGSGRTQWNSFSTTIATPGTHTLQFLVADQTDQAYDSGLLIDDVRVQPHADLSVTKDDGTTLVVPGQALTYTITATNAGPSPTTGAMLSDNFPTALTNISWACAASGGATCTATGTGDIADTVDLPVGGIITYTVDATVDPLATGILSNTAIISAGPSEFDPDDTDNSATDSDSIAGSNITQITDSEGASLTLKDGGLLWTAHASRSPAADDTGTIVAFVSNADLDPAHPDGNADLGSEIFVSSGGAIKQITSVTQPVAFDHASRPFLSRTGQWLVFASSADLVTGSNADWNHEIFRFDRDTSTLIQVTFTTGCTNSRPTVSRNGARIAFETDCTDLQAGYNSDGNREVVVWENGVFVATETTGCSSFEPHISRHNQGRYTVFLSDCNLTGGNPDGSIEVVRLDRNNGNNTQITNTSVAAGEAAAAVANSNNSRYIAFIANSNPTGGNPDGSFEAFRFDSNTGSMVQITDTDPLTLHTAVSIDVGGQNIVVERLDLITGASEIIHVDAGTLAETALAGGTSRLPFSSLDGGVPTVVFSSGSDLVGANADGSLEVFSARVE